MRAELERRVTDIIALALYFNAATFFSSLAHFSLHFVFCVLDSTQVEIVSRKGGREQVGKSSFKEVFFFFEIKKQRLVGPPISPLPS